jgi:hypothetical protein
MRTQSRRLQAPVVHASLIPGAAWARAPRPVPDPRLRISALSHLFTRETVWGSADVYQRYE